MLTSTSPASGARLSAVEELLDEVRVGLVVLDPSGRHVWVNALFCHMVEREPEELVGAGLPAPYWDDDHRSQTAIAFDQLLHAHTSGPIELRFKKRGGVSFPVVVHPGTLRIEGGSAQASSFLVATVFDRSDAHVGAPERVSGNVDVDLSSRIARELVRFRSGDAASAEIKAAIAKIGAFHDVDRVGLTWIGKDGRGALVASWTRPGVRPSALDIEAPPLAWIAERARRGVVTTVDDVSALAGPDRDALRADDVGAVAVIPLDIDGATVGWMSYVVVARESAWPEDLVAELRQSAELCAHAFARIEATRWLEQSARRCRQVVDDQSELIVRWTADGRRTFVNRAYCQWAHLRAEDAIGTSVFGSADGRAWDAVLARAKTLTPSDPVATFDHRVELPDGSFGWQRWTDRAVYDAAGELVELQSVGRDVTDYHRVLDLLGASRERARAARERASRLVLEYERLKASTDHHGTSTRKEVRSVDANAFVGESAAFRTCVDRAARVASTEATVLLTGEDGTGRAHLAREIHRWGVRRDGPFVALRVDSVHPGQLDVELFGRVGDASEELDRSVSGRFEVAHGGTLFIEDVADIPLPLQAKLLRVLREGQVQPVDGTAPVPVDVRLVVATRRDLRAMVAAGEFIEDLYLRLGVYPIVVPALRDRRGDIALLAQQFVRQLGASTGRDVRGISRALLRRLETYDWPGNVRELKRFIERALVGATGPLLDADQGPADAGSPARTEPWMDLSLTLEQAEARYVRAVLEAVAWRIEGLSGAAARLGVPPSTLRSRMRKLRIARP